MVDRQTGEVHLPRPGEDTAAIADLRGRFDPRFVRQVEADGGFASGLLRHLRSRRSPMLLFRPEDLPSLPTLAARWDPRGQALDEEVAERAARWQVIAASNPTSRRFVPLDRASFDFTHYEHDDPQALRGLNRQRWFGALARMYWRGQDRRFFDALMDHWDFYAQVVPPPDEALIGRVHALGPSGMTAPYAELDSFCRLHMWWWAYWLMVPAPLMTPERNAVLLSRCLQLFDVVAARGIRDHEHNFTAMQMQAVHLWAAALPEVVGMTVWKHASRNTAESAMGRAVLPDGVHWEKSAGYHASALRWWATPCLLDARNGEEWAEPCGLVFRRMGQFIDAIITPDGHLPLLSDTDRSTGWKTALALLRCLQPDSRFTHEVAPTHESVWTSGGAEWPTDDTTTAPLPLTSFPAGGVAAVRPNADSLLLVDNGPTSAGHSHEDNMTIHFDALGSPVLVDPGRWVYAYDDPDRQWAVSAHAHNTIVIEDEPIAPGDPITARSFVRAAPGDSRIDSPRVQREGALARVTTGFRGFASDPGAHARRTVLAPLEVAEPWLVIIDSIAGSTPHRWVNSWLVPSSSPTERTVSGFIATLDGGVQLTAAALADEPLQVRDEPMFWCPNYAEKSPARWVRFSSRCRCDLRAFVFHVGPADQAPSVTLTTRGAEIRVGRGLIHVPR
jgi:hypothetical protein